MDKFIDEIKTMAHVCGFCLTNSHEFCKGVIRNGDLSLVKCPCVCVLKKTERCTQCFSAEPGDLGRPWLCDDRSACDARIAARLAESPTYQKIVALQERIASQPTTSRPSAKRGAACLCCGEPTKGGKFLPGHDSRWLKDLSLNVMAGLISRADQVAKVAEISPALAAKFEKRLDA